MLAGAMLLRHVGEAEAGERLEDAVAATIADGVVTADLRGPGATDAASTDEVTAAVVAHLGR
jgi:isocitrate/isopropylmalate dehydrogenase